tara:strand:- start:394 stop:579 length:186 start_codon:yes stop_codon:yes gene_type:complete
MNKIKFLKNNEVELNGVKYKGYSICELPANFGCIEFNEKEGVSEWFKLPSPYEGLTFIAKK